MGLSLRGETMRFNRVLLQGGEWKADEVEADVPPMPQSTVCFVLPAKMQPKTIEDSFWITLNHDIPIDAL